MYVDMCVQIFVSILRLNDECIEDLTKVLHNHRFSLTKNFVEAKMVRSSAKNLQWRINISLQQWYSDFYAVIN